MTTVRRPKRIPGRARERGATLFVVVLAVTLLTGVGLYTVHSAALSERAAGNGRQARQAQGLTELYTIATLSNFRREVESRVTESGNATNPDSPGPPCVSNAGIALAPCLTLVETDVPAPTGVPLVAADSLGPLGTTGGSVRIDLTEVYGAEVPKAGSPASGPKDFGNSFYSGTATVVGRLNPAGAGAVTCVEGMMQSSAQHQIRVHLLFGPI